MIPSAAYRHPIVLEALREADDVIESWIETCHLLLRSFLRPYIGNRSRIFLREQIAVRLLLAQGYDIAGLVDTISRAQSEAEVADILGAWRKS